MMKFFKKKTKNNDIYFKLHVNFGYWEDSPIPSKNLNHKNFSAVVLVVPGMKGSLFPDQSPETIEFLSYIEDEKGRPCGIRCKVRDYSEKVEKAFDELGVAQNPEMELELFPDQQKHQEASDFKNGVTTHIYRQYKLERIKPEERQERSYYLSGNLYHKKHDK